MPLLVFVYFTQFLDKNILSYASIMGFPVEGIWYNDVAQAFYMGFLVWMFRKYSYKTLYGPDDRPIAHDFSFKQFMTLY